MKLLFAYDHRFLRNGRGDVFTSGPMPSGVWDRYLRHFDTVDVLARIEDVDNPEDAARADRDHVAFLAGPDLNSFRRLLRRPQADQEAVERAVSRCDAVVGRVPSELGLAALREAERQKKPALAEVVGCPWDTYWNHGAIAARLFAPVATRRMKNAVSCADYALYVTQDFLQSRYPCRSFSVSASNVELAPASQAALKKRQERYATLASGRLPVLGTIASLRVRYKGIQTAIAALGQLRAGGLDLEYHVLGGGDAGPYRALAHEHRVDDLVHFDGKRKAGAEVSDWLDGIDLYLQPSLQEGLPRATIEAMGQGICCVGSTCGGIPELLPVERLHKPGSSSELAAILGRYARDPQGLIEGATRDLRISENYHPELLAERRDVIFCKLREHAKQEAIGD